MQTRKAIQHKIFILEDRMAKGLNPKPRETYRVHPRLK